MRRLLAAATLALLVPAAVSSAQDTTPAAAQIAPPPVSFIDESLSIDADTASRAGTKVVVLNGSSETVPVTLRVRPPAVGLSIEPRSAQSIPPGEEIEWTLEIASSFAKSYTGSLVATTPAGPPARLKLTVTPPAGETAGASSDRFAPKDSDKLTLPATNFIPSVLSPLGPALATLGVLVFVLGLIFFESLGKRGGYAVLVAGGLLTAAGAFLDAFGVTEADRPGFIGALLLMLGAALAALFAYYVDPKRRVIPYGLAVLLLLAAAIVGSVNTDLPRTPAPEMISVKPLPVSDVEADKRVGGVANDQGDVAELRTSKDGFELEPVGLDKASQYTGKAKLADSDVSVTVNVRDWWPWATLVLAGGVLLGAFLTNWYDVVRPRQKLAAAAESLQAQVAKLTRGLTERPRIDTHIREVLAAALEEHEAGRGESATKLFDDARAYVRSYRGLLRAFDELDALVVDLEDLGRVADGPKTGIPAVGKSRAAGRGQHELDEIDTTKTTELDAALTQVTEAQNLAYPVRQLAKKAGDLLQAAEAAANEDLIARARALRLKALEAPSVDALGDLHKEAEAIAGALPRIADAEIRLDLPDLRLFQSRVAKRVARAGTTTATTAKRRFEIRDAQMTLLTGLLAVMSGMLAVYFADSSWGQPEDYLKALLWGAAVSETTKLVTTLYTKRIAS